MPCTRAARRGSVRDVTRLSFYRTRPSDHELGANCLHAASAYLRIADGAIPIDTRRHAKSEWHDAIDVA